MCVKLCAQVTRPVCAPLLWTDNATLPSRSPPPASCSNINHTPKRTNEPTTNSMTKNQAMMHLSGHPNVVRFVGAYEDLDHVHIVTELCEGRCLLDAVMQRGALGEAEAAAVMRSLLRAVAYAHDLSLAHRDIKVCEGGREGETRERERGREGEWESGRDNSGVFHDSQADS